MLLTRYPSFSAIGGHRRPAYSPKHLLSVILLPRVQGVIDQREPRRPAPAELSVKAKDGDDILLLYLEGLGELGLNVTLGGAALLGIDQLDDLREIFYTKGAY